MQADKASYKCARSRSDDRILRQSLTYFHFETNWFFAGEVHMGMGILSL
ncbi:MAG: hypothetical protein KGZ25_09455 [Planctomycetes bacterium]|nr:hypothetical protein [Planctomycetota bacterium]